MRLRRAGAGVRLPRALEIVAGRGHARLFRKRGRGPRPSGGVPRFRNNSPHASPGTSGVAPRRRRLRSSQGKRHADALPLPSGSGGAPRCVDDRAAGNISELPIHPSGGGRSRAHRRMPPLPRPDRRGRNEISALRVPCGKTLPRGGKTELPSPRLGRYAAP